MKLLLIALSLLFSMQTSVAYPQDNNSNNNEAELLSYSSNLQSSMYDIDVVDSEKQETESYISNLVTQKAKAIINGDEEEVEEISGILNDYGMENLSQTEFEEILINSTNSIDAYYGPEDSVIIENKYSCLEKYISEFTYNNKTYNYMTIYAYPKSTSSNLYQSGAITVTKSSASYTGATSLLSSAVKVISGSLSKILNIGITIYDATSSFINSISNKSVISKIEANYTWNSVEVVCFNYFCNKEETDSYKLINRSNSVSVSVAVSIPSITYDSKVHSTIITLSEDAEYVGTFFSGGYLPSYYYISNNDLWVSATELHSFYIYGINGDKLKTVTLVNPSDLGGVV